MSLSNELSCEAGSFSHATHKGFYSQRLWSFPLPCWNPRLHGLSRSPIISPGLSTCKWGTTSHCLAMSFLSWIPISAPPTSLGGCFFFNSLVFRLPNSSIFWQFWLFLVFKFVFVLLSVVQGGRMYLPMPPSWPEVLKYNSIKFYTKPKNVKGSPDWCGSVDWVLACKPKGCWFNSHSGHMPGLQARSTIGGMQEATTHWCVCPSLSLSLPLCVKINK